MDKARRLITGLDAEGRSCFLSDGPSETVIGATQTDPADNNGVADAGGGPFGFPTSGTLFEVVDIPPGGRTPMHATDTIDYIAITSGEIVFVTETGETILRAGDVLVDRGILHAWRNDGKAPCRIFNVLCPAKPVGKGATMTGIMTI